MKKLLVLNVILLTIFSSCGDTPPAESRQLGKFNVDTDLYLAHFDNKTDVDDVHSVAAVATMLADQRFEGVRYHAVAGTYGIQDGLYVPANDLFELAFGEQWSDAHTDYDKALDEVSTLAATVISNGGSVWISDGGQSDFSADVVRQIYVRVPDADPKKLVHIVQHADWNEEVTDPEDLSYVKEAATYHRIPDGNTTGNGTPGFRSDEIIDWRKYISDPQLIEIWEKAIEIANTYNGVEDRYLNESIMKGGLDFSDTSESCWIFGFNDLVDSKAFLKEFGMGAGDGSDM